MSDEEPTWQSKGLCALSYDPRFFPNRGDSNKEAKEICARCPVQEICLEHALTKPERFGIWGGKSERERQVIRKQRKLDAEAET